MEKEEKQSFSVTAERPEENVNALQVKIGDLEKKLKETEEIRDMYHNMYYELLDKAEKYKNAVKSVVLFID